MLGRALRRSQVMEIVAKRTKSQGTGAESLMTASMTFSNRMMAMWKREEYLDYLTGEKIRPTSCEGFDSAAGQHDATGSTTALSAPSMLGITSSSFIGGNSSINASIRTGWNSFAMTPALVRVPPGGVANVVS